jgi:hypothetical protein
MTSTRIKVETVIDGQWVQQGPTCTVSEFLDVNPDFDPLYREQLAHATTGDVLEWNLGAAGVLKITALGDEPAELTEIKLAVAQGLRTQADRIASLIMIWTMDGPSRDTCKAIRQAIETEERLNSLAREFAPELF